MVRKRIVFGTMTRYSYEIIRYHSEITLFPGSVQKNITYIRRAIIRLLNVSLSKTFLYFNKWQRLYYERYLNNYFLFLFVYDSRCDKDEILSAYEFKHCYQQLINFIFVINECNAELSTEYSL